MIVLWSDDEWSRQLHQLFVQAQSMMREREHSDCSLLLKWHIRRWRQHKSPPPTLIQPRSIHSLMSKL